MSRMLEVHQDSRPPARSAPKGNSKFEILIIKIFSLKQKANQILPATIEKKVLSLEGNNLMFLPTITSTFM